MKVAGDDGAEVSWSERILTVRKHGWRYSTKLVEGTYPDYRRVIAPTCPAFITVDRAELVAAVTRLDVLADRRSALSLSWDDDPAELHLALNGNGEGVEGLPCEAPDMKAGKISVASGPFLGLLEAISGTQVQLHIRSYRESFRLVDPDCPDLIAVQAPCAVFEQAQNAA
jgi:DNA polymerase III sliding clamp (beta) subunit (PCNA family)